VVWIRGPIKIAQVAADAVGAGISKVTVHMTLGTLQLDVSPRQSEAGELGVIELCPKPAIHGVALLAVSWEPQRRVVWVTGPLEIGFMT